MLFKQPDIQYFCFSQSTGQVTWMVYLFIFVQNYVHRIKILSKCLFDFENKLTAGETLAGCLEVFLF